MTGLTARMTPEDKERDNLDVFIPHKEEYVPTIGDIESWFNDSGCPCTGPCECWIEHDGICSNGYESQFKAMGLI